MTLWERCRICGDEWVAGTRSECPKYRDGEHRRCRTNVHSQDVMLFSKPESAEPVPPPSVPDPHLVTQASWSTVDETEPDASQQPPNDEN